MFKPCTLSETTADHTSSTNSNSTNTKSKFSDKAGSYKEQNMDSKPKRSHSTMQTATPHPKTDEERKTKKKQKSLWTHISGLYIEGQLYCDRDITLWLF